MKKTELTIKQISVLAINNNEDMKTAVEYLSILNKYLDELTLEKERVTKPLNEALRAERARFKPREIELETAIEKLRNELSKYQTEQVRLKAIEEAKIVKKLEQGKITMDKAVDKVDKLSQIEDKVKTDSGSISFKTSYKLVICNLNKVPREYMIVDEKKVIEALKANKEVEGCRLEETLIPINYR